MYSCSSRVNEAIPAEYRTVAEELFPPGGFPPGQGPVLEAAIGFAEILGIGLDYKHLLASEKADTGLRAFLGHFQNNLDLLIQKTWVEKADEARKENLQDRLPGFIAAIEGAQYLEALAEFSEILDELAYLFFGVQSSKDDFTEYTLRIDTQMGLFWWYGGQIGCLQPPNKEPAGGASHRDGTCSQDVYQAILLIGICYLTNF
jgi:hypothetical protein